MHTHIQQTFQINNEVILRKIKILSICWAFMLSNIHSHEFKKNEYILNYSHQNRVFEIDFNLTIYKMIFIE